MFEFLVVPMMELLEQPMIERLNLVSPALGPPGTLLRQLHRVRFRMQDLWPEQDAAFGKETTKVGKGGDQHDHAHVVL
jgi:hypothetical protein